MRDKGAKRRAREFRRTHGLGRRADPSDHPLHWDISSSLAQTGRTGEEEEEDKRMRKMRMLPLEDTSRNCPRRWNSS